MKSESKIVPLFLSISYLCGWVFLILCCRRKQAAILIKPIFWMAPSQATKLQMHWPILCVIILLTCTDGSPRVDVNLNSWRSRSLSAYYRWCPPTNCVVANCLLDHKRSEGTSWRLVTFFSLGPSQLLSLAYLPGQAPRRNCLAQLPNAGYGEKKNKNIS